MTITDVRKDPAAGTMAIVADYQAPPERVWQLWADPRLLERWWGPPSHPATVTDHHLAPGGVVRYYMTGPAGEKYHGGWQVVSLSPPERLEFEDYFADEHGQEAEGMPRSSTVVSIEGTGEGTTRMTIDTRYASAEALAQVLEMGMEEGIRQALGQTDALLAASAASTAD